MTERTQTFCIIVLNWNNASDTIECLDSILPSVQSGLASVIVCDNASSDDSVDSIVNWANQNFSNIRDPLASDIQKETEKYWDFLLLRLSSNRGYAAGNNAGIRQALSHHDFPYIFVINNDAILHQNALEELSNFSANNPDFGIVGCTILYDHNRNMVQCAGGCTYNPWTTIFRNHHEDLPLEEVIENSEVAKLDYISGAACLFRTDILRKFGLFDEQYFLYYEELDIARRLVGSQYKLGWCKTSLVFHKGGASTRDRKSQPDMDSSLTNYHENLSTLLFTIKHHFWYFPVAVMFRFFGKSLKYIYSGKFYLFPILISAYTDFFSIKFGITRAEKKTSEKILYIGCIEPESS